jgi:hypothetical protein
MNKSNLCWRIETHDKSFRLFVLWSIIKVHNESAVQWNALRSTLYYMPGGGGTYESLVCLFQTAMERQLTLLYPPAPGGPGGGGGGAELSSGGGGGGAPPFWVGVPACAIWLW